MLHSEPMLKRLSRAGPDLRNELRNFKNRSIIMRKKPRKERSMKELWSAFENQSTFHGICHASNAPSRRWRAMWYIAFTICTCILIGQCIMVITRYFQYEKTVDLDLKFEKAPFPSVTLCNLNPYKKSAVENEKTVKAELDAYDNAIKAKAAAAAATGDGRRRKRAAETPKQDRRYHPVYAPCVCEVGALSGLRKPGSCLATHKGTVLGDFSSGSTPINYRPSRCMCDFDTWSKTLWPCYPYQTWKERLCTECTINLGHCPMKFTEKATTPKTPGNKKGNAGIEQPKPGSKKGNAGSEQPNEVCLCHEEFNHCISNKHGFIPEISLAGDLKTFDPTSPSLISSTTTTTTAAPEVVQAQGFEQLTDEIAISTQARENVIFAVASLPDENRNRLAYAKDEFILKCSFNQRDCDIENDFQRHYDSTYGNCYTFNWNVNNSIIASRAGANYGLRVLVYANISEYLSTSESVGFRITVHDKVHVPFPDAFGYSAPTGFLTSFGVRMKQFSRQGHPYGDCQEGGEQSEDNVYDKRYKYSVEGCMRSCTQKAVVRDCGCADPLYPKRIEDKYCPVNDPFKRECIKNTTQRLGDETAERKAKSNRTCDCHQPCRETSYEMTFSTSRWPSGTAKVMECTTDDDLCLERYRRNAAMVQIFYEELNYESMSESPAYTITSVIADLGGLTGLWIGASVVSLLELVVLVYLMSKTYYGQQKKKSSAMPPSLVVSHSNSRVSESPARPNNPIVTVKEPSPSPPVHISSSPSTSPEPSAEEETKLIDSPPPTRKSTLAYVPPSGDLPCSCDTDSTDHITKLNIFCPEHGYLVRRNTSMASNHQTPKSSYVPDDDDDGDDVAEDEEEEEEEEEDESGSKLPSSAAEITTIPQGVHTPEF